uniref:Uncharacterized protein n=1 Tax=Eutreptiella gymnastica TaxID=73025 RepID=A0A7S1HW73_9EUGL|mmetsp:Transcript_109221/g.189296  ORF Transcript_109221/g.189296 Transcript_109221/m.189296 type:complete len:165 (+) Transcript_109221:61-555(+)
MPLFWTYAKGRAARGGGDTIHSVNTCTCGDCQLNKCLDNIDPNRTEPELNPDRSNIKGFLQVWRCQIKAPNGPKPGFGFTTGQARARGLGLVAGVTGSGWESPSPPALEKAATHFDPHLRGMGGQGALAGRVGGTLLPEEGLICMEACSALKWSQWWQLGFKCS